MMLDKELYRKAYEQYRKWNEAELAGRARNAGRLSPAEAWERYLALADFAWESCPPPSQMQRQQKLADLKRYYARVQAMEAWRRMRGESS